MPYTHIATGHIRDRELQRAVTHASALLADVYSMLGVNPPPGSNGGECNFAIGLVLACIIDGLATEVWPIEPFGNLRDHQFKRIEKVVGRFQWGRKADGWVTQLEAAKVVYHEIRNPLVHQLGADPRWSGRRPGFGDAAILVEMFGRKRVSPDQLEALGECNLKWPIVWVKPKADPGVRRLVVSAPALYWHVKRVACDLAADEEILARALELRKRRVLEMQKRKRRRAK